MKNAKLKPFLFTGAVGATVLVSTAAHAQSSVTLYGFVEEEVEYVNNSAALGQTSGGKSLVKMTTASWRASRFGLKGNEDIGGGTAVIFDLQAGFNPNTGASSTSGLLFNRYAYVGITNQQYGTLTLGRQYTPYLLLATQNQSPAWLTGAFGAHPGDIDAQDASWRVNNEIVYVSPTYAGLTLGASYSVPGVAGSETQGATWSAALRYINGPFSASTGVLRVNNPTHGGGVWSADTSTQPVVSAINNGYQTAEGQQRAFIGIGYAFNNHVEVLANYSNTQYIAGGGSSFKDTAIFNTYGAAVHFTISPFFNAALGYSLVTTTKANGITDSARYQQITASQWYLLSKRTTLFAVEAVQRASGKTLGTAGAGHIIDATAAIGDGFNSNPSSSPTQAAVTIGISHSF